MTRSVVSYCRVCPALCGIIVDVGDDGRVERVRGDREHPLSRGYTCVKGRALPEEVHAPDRLTGALRREPDGSFSPVDTSAAIDEIAANLVAIIEEHGPRAVALYVGTRGYEVLPLAGARAWLAGIGSPSFYSTYTIDQPGKDLARARHGSWPAGFQDAATSDVVMLVGTNPVVSSVTPYIGLPATNLVAELRALRRRGLRVVVVDPRRTETALHADVHLRPRPGTDPVVLAGMLRVILGDGAHDRDFVERFATGIDELAAAVAPFTPELVEQRTGVPAPDLVAAARLFARGPRGCAVGGTGVNMSGHPTLNEYLLLCLNTVCGRYQRAGDRVANPGVLTRGRHPVEGPRGPRAVAGVGPEQPRVRGLATLYDQMPSAALAEEILEPGDGRIRALVVSGGNPLVALPDLAKTRRAFAQLELLVTLDVRMAQTASVSDYVVACPTSLEKSDATVASDLRFPVPFAQYTPAVVDAGPGLIEEWDFFRRLARAMHAPWDLTGRLGLPIPIDVGGDTLPAAPAADDLWELVCNSGAVRFAEVRAHPHGLAPDLAVRRVEAASAPTAPGDHLQLADGAMLEQLGEILTDRATVTTNGSYPFLLTSRRMTEYYNSWGQDVPSVRVRHGANPAFVHPDDLEVIGVVDGGLLRIESAHGAIEAVARAADDVARATVSIAHCWGGADGSPVNLLVDNVNPDGDEIGMARQSAVPVRISPISIAGRPDVRR